MPGFAVPTFNIAHLIQVSIGPVFLLSGVAATLNVLTSRLARIVDRAREMEDRAVLDHEQAAELQSRLRVLALLAALSLLWVLWQPATTTRDVKPNRARVAYGIDAFAARDPLAWPGFATVADVAGLRRAWVQDDAARADRLADAVPDVNSER